MAWSAVTGRQSGIPSAHGEPPCSLAVRKLVQLRLQALGIEIPKQFFQMLPYLLTMIVLAGVVGRTVGPKAMGRSRLSRESGKWDF